MQFKQKTFNLSLHNAFFFPYIFTLGKKRAALLNYKRTRGKIQLTSLIQMIYDGNNEFLSRHTSHSLAIA